MNARAPRQRGNARLFIAGNDSHVRGTGMPRAPVVDRDSFPAMKSNERRKRKLLAARETARVLEAREDARAETLVRLGKSANRYEGSTPHEVDGAHTFAPRVLQTRMSAHEGSTRRSGRKGTLKFVPARHDAGAPKHGGARLPAGQWLDRATGEPRVASTSAIASTSTIARRDAMRLGRARSRCCTATMTRPCPSRPTRATTS